MDSGTRTEHIGPGVHTLAAGDYHDDLVADVPSLSATIAKLLINQSPAHAFAQHPRLNPHYVRVDEQKFDVGTVAHSVLLEGTDAVEVIDFDDWRTNTAKEARDAARAAGKIPLLGKHYFDVLQMVGAARAQLAVHEAVPPLFVDGKPEQTLVWFEDGVQCRARLDWLRDDYTAIDDLKTTARSARPEEFARALYGVGNDISAAFYLRGVRALTGAEPIFRWCVVETSPPFALSVVTPGRDVLALADDKIDYALKLWRTCLASGEWPAYDRRVATAELPGWEEARWMERTAA